MGRTGGRGWGQKWGTRVVWDQAVGFLSSQGWLVPTTGSPQGTVVMPPVSPDPLSHQDHQLLDQTCISCFSASTALRAAPFPLTALLSLLSALSPDSKLLTRGN